MEVSWRWRCHRSLLWSVNGGASLEYSILLAFILYIEYSAISSRFLDAYDFLIVRHTRMSIYNCVAEYIHSYTYLLPGVKCEFASMTNRQGLSFLSEGHRW